MDVIICIISKSHPSVQLLILIPAATRIIWSSKTSSEIFLERGKSPSSLTFDHMQEVASFLKFLRLNSLLQSVP